MQARMISFLNKDKIKGVICIHSGFVLKPIKRPHSNQLLVLAIV